MASEMKPKDRQLGGTTILGRVKEWFQRHSRLLLIVLVAIVVIIGIYWFLNMNAAGRQRSAIERLEESLVSISSRPHMVAPVILDDMELIVLPGIPNEAAAQVVLNKFGDISFRAIDPAKVDEAVVKMGLSTEDELIEPENVAELGSLLGADFLMITSEKAGPVPIPGVSETMIGANHWKAVVVDVESTQIIGFGEVWLEGSEENPQPQSSFRFLTRIHPLHTPTIEENLAAAEEFLEIADKFGDTTACDLAYLYAGNAYFQAGSFEKASDAYSTGETKSKHDDIAFQCRLGAADCLSATEDYDAALLAYEALLSGEGVSVRTFAPTILMRMADCYSALDDNEGEKRVLEQLLHDHPNSPWLDIAMSRYQGMY